LVTARRQRSRGFTLIELLVAMALTTVGLVGLVALQSIAIRGNMMSRNFGEAMGIAQSRLEEAEHTLYANLPAMTEGTCAATSPPTSPTCNGAVLSNLSPDPASTTEAIYSRCTVATTDLTNNKTTIQVTVCWNDLGYNGITNKTVHAVTLYTVRSP
jgi:prepilin-type N-terminal cleavage/methylation domain-containing protein